MGITQASLERLKRHDLMKPCKVLILGCQNLYFNPHYGQIAHSWFEKQGFEVATWDITGCQGSEIKDLREQQEGQYDLILDHGTTEHCDGNYYQVNKNLHDLCKVGGYIVRENPKTGNWPGHGCNYLDTDFYTQLAAFNNYSLVECIEEAAMGNISDGWNICAVMRKRSDNPFMSIEEFNKLPVYDK